MSDIKWITVKDAAELLGVTDRAIQKALTKNRYKVKPVLGQRARGGKAWLIDITSLPPSVQEKWVRKIAAGNEERAERLIAEDPQKDSLRYSAQQIKEADRRYEITEQFHHILNSLEPRKAERAREFAIEKGVSLGTLYRWRKGWLESGMKTASLIPYGRVEKESRLGDWEKKEFGRLYLRKEKVGVSVCYGVVQEMAQATGRTIASYSSFLRYAKEIEPIVASHTRDREKEHQDKFRYTIKRGYRDIRSNEGFCGDHKQLDIWVIGQKGKPVRPWLTGWEDLRSRSISGFALVDQASSESIAIATRHAFLKKEKETYVQHGLPEWVYIDNGRDYASKRISGKMLKIGKIDYNSETKGVFRDLGIKIRFALPKHPQSKPIERFFRTIDEQLICGLPGYCGSTPFNRPDAMKNKSRKDMEKMGLWAIERLYQHIESWTVRNYHNSPHRGEGMDGESPLEVWMQNLPEKIRTVDEKFLNILLLKGDQAKVTREGVRFRGYLYDLTEELIPYQERWVNIRYDPNEMGRLWCWNGRDYIGQTKSKKLLSWGTTEEDHKGTARIRKAQTRYKRRRAEELIGAPDADILKKVAESRKKNEKAFCEGAAKNIQEELGKRTEMVSISEEFREAVENVKEKQKKANEAIRREMSEEGIMDLLGSLPEREEEPELLFGENNE